MTCLAEECYSLIPPFCSFPLFPLFFQVLGESMAGISQNCKTGDVPAFGGCVGLASKALCGLTEAAGQVRTCYGVPALDLPHILCEYVSTLCVFCLSWGVLC